MTVYSDTGARSSYIDMICNPDNLSQKQVRNAAAITWAEVNYASKSYTRDVLKIDPASNETNRPIFQLHARSKIIVAWIQGCFDKESLKALSLKSNAHQWNILACDGGGAKCDGPTMIKLIFN